VQIHFDRLSLFIAKNAVETPAGAKISNTVPSRFHNVSDAALADEIGRVDAIAKSAEAELKALKDEFKAKPRGGDETPVAFRKAAPLRPEVEHGTAARCRRREPKAHWGQLDVAAGGSHRRGEVGDADVIGLRKVRFALAGRPHSSSCIISQ
jgi:hypothetical protein